MTDGEPKFNPHQKTSPEWAVDFRGEEEQEIIRLIKEKGWQDPETKDKFTIWLEAVEAQLDQEAGNHRLDSIKVTLKIARLARLAGDIEGAQSNYDIAAEQAWQEQLDDLNEQIVAELEELEDYEKPEEDPA